jgi:hypothetical protein
MRLAQTLSFAALTLLAACGAPDELGERRTPSPTVDAASSADAPADVPTSVPADDVAPTPDRGTPAIEAGSPAPDGGLEAGEGRDGGVTADAQPDAQQPPEAGAPQADSGGGTADAGAPRDADAGDGARPDAGLWDGSMIVDAAPDAGGVPGYDGGRVITLVLTDPRDACTRGNVNCMGVNMPLILTGMRGVVSDVPTICVAHGELTAWAFEPALCSYGVCRQIGEDPFYPPGCVRGCAVPKKWGGYPAGTSPLCY